MSTLDAEALATLTPEEREAIQSTDMSPEEIAALQRIADGAGTGAAGDGDDDDDDPADGAGQAAPPVEGQGAAPSPTPAPAQVPAPTAQAEAAPAAAAAPEPRAPRYEAKLPEDYDAKVQNLSEREAELKRMFKSGEIEFDDFEAQRDELLREREQLTIVRTKAEISQEMTAQTAEQQWLNTVQTFVSSTAQLPADKGGIDYRIDTEKAADLDTFVKTLAARNEHADKSMDWFLKEAHRRVLALHSLGSQASAPAPAPSPPPAPVSRKPSLEAVPTTLAQVPGGDGPGDVTGEFSDVLSLEGLEYEQAIARMTPSQRERFLRAA